MGTGNIPTATDGTPIPASDHNSLAAAIKDDFVPRDTSTANPTDLAGTLGSTLYRWANAYLRKITLGVAANLVTLEESASQMFIKISGVTKTIIDTDGLDGSFLKAGSVPFSALTAGASFPIKMQTFTANGTFNVPSNVDTVIVMGCGGGGGAGNNGGSGGNGAPLGQQVVSVTPGGTVAVVIGAGGAGGAAGTIPTPTNNGSAGISSSFGTLNFRGGAGGIGNPGSTDNQREMGVPGKTPGGSAAVHGANYNTGSNGGGGAGPFGDGANGAASSGVAGSNGAANSGGGGGGGGGGGSSSGAGGNGGSGRVIVIWTGN